MNNVKGANLIFFFFLTQTQEDNLKSKHILILFYSLEN